jgi:transposase
MQEAQLDLGEDFLVGEVSKSTPKPTCPDPPARIRCKVVDRYIHEWREFDLDQLIEEDHPARALVTFIDQLDLSGFEQDIQALQGQSGQSPFAPAVLIALWLQACCDGVGSARELSRRCIHHPVYRWICGDTPINYHTLSDFRVKRREALDQLFVDVLGVLHHKRLIRLNRVMHDGTKIRAVASPSSMHREKTIEESLKEAQEQVNAMGDPEQDRPNERVRRNAEERVRRLAEAREILKQQQARKKTAAERAEVRVSSTEPEARTMKLPDKSFAPAYNGQITTDAEHSIIVGVQVTQQGSDFEQLGPALEEVQERFGQMPCQTVVDGGYVSRGNIVELCGTTDLIGPANVLDKDAKERQRRSGIADEFIAEQFVYDAATNRFQCPVGCYLKQVSKRAGPGKIDHLYQARTADCEKCAHKAQCCPQTEQRRITRVEEEEAVRRFRKKMEGEDLKAIYKTRSQIAEFPNCWLKEKFGLRRFHVRGLAKVGAEMLWHVIAYNVQQWIRLVWRQAESEAA